MPIITAVKPQKSGKRVNIYLDGKFGFGLDLENFVKLGLKVEQNLREQEIEGIVKKAEFQKTLDKILKFATLRPRSEKEVKDWLERKKIHQSLHAELFDRIKRLDLIDDEKFAVWWVGQRQSFRPKPKRILNYELRIKGIDKGTIEKVLAEVKVNEVEVAKKLLEKKIYSFKNLDEYEVKRKMSEFLARKGFSWEVIKQVIKKMGK